MNKKIFRSTLLVALLVLLASLILFLGILFGIFGRSLSLPEYTPAELLDGIAEPLIIVIIIAVGLSFLLSYRVSRAIVEPINALDLDNPSANDTYEELSPLLRRISAQNRTIARRIKEAERRQEEFRLITENMSDGFITIDEVGNILTYNSAALRLLNIENMSGGNILNFNRTKEFRGVVYDVLEGRRAESEIMLGEHVYNLMASPVFDESKTIGAIILVLDITESFKREQLRREFTANVSHELKTPLTSISGFAEIMKSGMTDESMISDFSSSIYDEAQRLITLVADIIKLTELDEGSIAFEKEGVDLFSLANEIAEYLAPAAERAGVSVSVTGESAEVFGARKILDEMIYNLADNAIKYNKRGGKVDISVKNGEGSVLLTVRDDGIGIPQSEHARVFERFYRVDKSHSKEVGGTGLGLSIVKHGAIYHNAQILLESKPNEGTTVTITF